MVKIRAPLDDSPRLRERERGMTIFIVVLVLTMLTGIGLFAARMTSSVDSATGYVRQAIQAQGLSLYAGQLAANVLIDQAGIIKNAMEQAAASNRGATCPSNRGTINAYCAYRTDVELASLVARYSQTLLLSADATTAGSLSPIRPSTSVPSVEGAMQVEFLDVARAIPQAGASMGSNTNTAEAPYEFGVNAWAQVRSVTTTTSQNWCQSDAASTSANIQAARLYITVPHI